MPLSAEKQCLFIHVPKCAGTSLTEALKTCGVRLEFEGRTPPDRMSEFGGRELWLHHLSAIQLKTAIGAATWNLYFKFAFVRNPWDRMVSYYHYHKIRSKDEQFRRDWPSIASIFMCTDSFEEWVRAGIYVPQASKFVCDEQGELMVDFVGKVESVQVDFAKICERLNVPATLPHVNATKHSPYHEYYNSDLRTIVARHFSEDIERFSYTFE